MVLLDPGRSVDHLIVRCITFLCRGSAELLCGKIPFLKNKRALSRYGRWVLFFSRMIWGWVIGVMGRCVKSFDSSPLYF